MLVMVTNPRQLACQVGSHIMCDRHRSVARATNLTARARHGAITPQDDVRFSYEIISTSSAFAPGRALCFGSLAYVVDHICELHLFRETSSKDSESPTSSPLADLRLTNLEVQSNQIHLSLGLNPSMFGAPPDVLHTSECPPSDCHRRGSPACPPFAKHLFVSSL
jgi:hypothetical protein